MSFWRVVAGVGKTLIWSGMLILAFVGYQLWGTGVAEARNQDSLRDQFAKSLATKPAAADPGPIVLPPSGAVAIIKAPKIGMDKTVIEGVTVDDLKKGPGHYPETPMPGQAGNAAIAGHRTTYGAPFYRLDELVVGDLISVTTKEGQFNYRVSESKVVGPDDAEVLNNTPDNRLTLTTCHPRFTAAQRLIVIARLEGKAKPPTPVEQRPAPKLDEKKAGLSGEQAPRQPAVGWGAAAAFAWLGTWAASRLWLRWPAYALGVPVFLVLLFVFFENFSRLLPANI